MLTLPLRYAFLAFSLLFLPALPATALAQGEMDIEPLIEGNEFPIVKFHGQAGRVGTSEGKSDVRIRQAFEASDLRALDLDNPEASVTIQSIMVDEDGTELVTIGGEDPSEIPLLLGRGGKPWKGTFKRQGRDRQNLRVDVEQRASQIRTVIRFARSLVDVPLACLRGDERAFLTTELTVDDGSDAGPVRFVATQPWRCKPRRGGDWELRGQNAQDHAGHHGHNEGPENRRPQVKFAIENETRENGVPNLIEVDASRSEDHDGTIVTYSFRVLDRDTEAMVYQAGPQASPKTTFWLPPGEYLVWVTVVDNDGSSHSETRRANVRD